MRRIFKPVSLFISISIFIFNNAYANDMQIEIIDYGVYKQKSQFTKILDNDAVTGYRSESESINAVQLLLKTTNIPLIKGTIFGFRANIKYSKETPITVTVRCEHPLIKHPDGTQSTYYEFNKTINKDNNLPEGGIMFRFSEDFELVSGKWKFMVLQGKTSLVVKEFTTHESF